MSLINVRINLSKVDKDKLYKGEKGIYLDVVVAERKEASQYGQTHTVYMNPTKEEREKNADKIYIGDGTLKSFDNSLSESEKEELPF